MPESLGRLLPRDERDAWEVVAPGTDTKVGRLAADVVVLAKFDRNTHPKFRAAYARHGLMLAFQPLGSNGMNGIDRAVNAYRTVSQFAPNLIPRLHGVGYLAPDLPYLVESLLEGTPLVTGPRLAAAVPEILAGLSQIHRGYGLVEIQLSRHWPRLAERWDETRNSGLVSETLGSSVGRLIARDAHLTGSLVHGDLSASNIVRGPDGITLIDWEYSQVAPILLDGAKLHLYSPAPEATLVAVLDSFRESIREAPHTAVRMYSPEEQLALSHANMISLYSLRRAALVGHPRATVLELQIQRQTERLSQVMDRCG